MSEGLAALIGMMAALNPAAAALAAGGPVARRLAAAAVAIAGGLLLVSVVLARPLLDAISVSPESFRVAAGIVMVVSAVQVTLLARRARQAPATYWDALHPLALPALAGPAAIALGISVSANEGIGLAVAAAVIALATGGAALLWGPRAAFGTVARFAAALLVVLGVGEIVDGVKSV